MCGTALGDQSDPLARSISISSVFMLSMPFILFASVGGWFLLRHLRARRSAAFDVHSIVNQESAR